MLFRSSANKTLIQFPSDGVYNIQFSAQLEKLSGGGTLVMSIWFAKNGTALPNTNTSITFANNNHLVVASWNFMVNLSSADYIQIMTYNTAGSISIVSLPAGGPIPATPSTILTVVQVA